VCKTLTNEEESANLKRALFRRFHMSKIHKIFQPVARGEDRLHALSDQQKCRYPYHHEPIKDSSATPSILMHGDVMQFSLTIGLVLISVTRKHGKEFRVWQLVVSPDQPWIRNAIDAKTGDGRPSVMDMLKSAPDCLETVPLIRGSGIFCTVVHRGCNPPLLYASWDYLHGAEVVIDDYYARMGSLARWFTKKFTPLKIPQNAWGTEREVVGATKTLRTAAASLLNRLEAQPHVIRRLVQEGHDLMPRKDDGTLYLEDGGADIGARVAMDRAHSRGNLTLCGIDLVSGSDLEHVPERVLSAPVPKPEPELGPEPEQESAGTIVPVGLPSRNLPSTPPPIPSGLGDTVVPGRMRGDKTRRLGRRVTPSGRKKKED
jgi:hypothetical protein